MWETQLGVGGSAALATIIKQPWLISFLQGGNAASILMGTFRHTSRVNVLFR